MSGYLFDQIVDLIYEKLAPKVDPDEADELAEALLNLIEDRFVDDLYS